MKDCSMKYFITFLSNKIKSVGGDYAHLQVNCVKREDLSMIINYLLLFGLLVSGHIRSITSCDLVNEPPNE